MMFIAFESLMQCLIRFKNSLASKVSCIGQLQSYTYVSLSLHYIDDATATSFYPQAKKNGVHIWLSSPVDPAAWSFSHLLSDPLIQSLERWSQQGISNPVMAETPNLLEPFGHFDPLIQLFLAR